MNANEQLIHAFYSAFQQKDHATMQSCYAEQASFSDPVFQNLDASEVRAMWEMLCRNGKDLQLTYRDVWADEQSGRARWVATYTFSATGNRVENRISASFRFEGGKIVRHDDHFSFFRWARQAFGLPGWLLGWLPQFKEKVQQTARKNLAAFILRRNG